ncbi:hypothetical protein Y1Q_0022423 [Alligator mississippiensis]|uniref:Uncharacterized protein n=1 Tax=Alligator mississippiensis TaxID=8496 RepID=A0A151N037_ALLMI|nr:hypothetical protein Y1Q_0022423 [Alligator mississippiensis]
MSEPFRLISTSQWEHSDLVQDTLTKEKNLHLRWKRTFLLLQRKKRRRSFSQEPRNFQALLSRNKQA